MKHKRLSILAAGALLATSLTPLANVSAWEVSPASGSATYTITRKVTGVSSNVTNTFTYTITASDTNPATVASAPTSATVVFNNVAPASGEASAQGTIDFSSAKFSKVGDYSFVITETGTTDAANYPLSTDYYTAWVSVRNEVNTTTGALTGNHIVSLGGVTDADGEKVNATPGESNGAIFDGGAVRTYISVSKTVTGNAADEDECFPFSVSFTGVPATTFALTIANTNTGVSACADNPATLSSSSSNTIYLKHGDTATIGNNSGNYQIPVNTSYTVTESTPSGYTAKVDGAAGATATKTALDVSAATFNTANKTAFENNKEGNPRTGVVFSILPFIVIALIGIFGAAYVAKTKKATE